MSKFESNSIAFHINWKITFLSLLFLPLLVFLGFWQLERGHQKQTILDVWQRQQALEPLDLSSIQASRYLDRQGLSADPVNTNLVKDDDQSFRQVKFDAVLDSERFWLVEGKIYRGAVGYHVVMPAIIEANNTLVLVNRGWIKSGLYREDIPNITTPSGLVTITGNLSNPSKTILIGEDNPRLLERSWPKRVLDLRIDKMSKEYGKPFLNRVIQINPDSPHALEAFWPRINVSPAKHHGYAFQWFAMALALIMLWLHANTNVFSRLKGRAGKLN